MTKEDITQKLMEIACEVHGDGIHLFHITPETDLEMELGFDSLDFTSFDIRIEDEFNININSIDEVKLGHGRIKDFTDIIYNLINS